MSLDEFDHAIDEEGRLYELNKGVIEMVDVPMPDHGFQLQEARDQLTAYRLAHPGVIQFMGGGSEAKLLIKEFESERHQDLAVYLTRAPSGPDVWSVWVPEIVVEVVSKRSIKRDYEEKPDEYRAFGVAEYWIIDAARQQMTVMGRWRGIWKPRVFRGKKKYATTRLPGFALDLKRILSVIK